ncbi:MAG: tRNA (adenosine(37)-N6)-dimethylallyltransferase MiaA [Patescibacteria group bacterium]|nr:tRNA (adenosine(37)-N6)-dimethylallyltransferase MiaA [Patescibacteria group bacterium]
MPNNLKNNQKSLVLVILGPTASGKTSLGVRLADKYNGEIVSADSRQVYQGMDIGTGKDLAEYELNDKKTPYHLIDIVSPNIEFNLAKYTKLANQALSDICARKKLPIIVGGTGLYLQALVDNYELSEVKPNEAKRQELESLSRDDLYLRLEKLKPDFARKLNNSDKLNPRRLVRYLEIFEQGGELPKKQEPKYEFLLIGLNWPDEILRERIIKRINDRLDNEGMVAEVEGLHADGLSWQRLISFGLEYKFISYYLLEKLSYEEMVAKLSDASYRFAKRQKTWFKRWEKQGRKINWVNNQAEAEELINDYL